MNELFSALLKESLSTSQFEEKRNYVSLSNIYKPVEELINDYKNGYSTDDSGRLKCRLGYWMEKGMKERLLRIKGIADSYCIEVPGTNGLIKGHPDFRYVNIMDTATFRNPIPGDCKSYAFDEHLPDEKKIPKKIYWQMNAYMFYSGVWSSVLVCESRESGRFKVITVRRNNAICNAIEEKVNEIKQLLLTSSK